MTTKDFVPFALFVIFVLTGILIILWRIAIHIGAL